MMSAGPFVAIALDAAILVARPGVEKHSSGSLYLGEAGASS